MGFCHSIILNRCKKKQIKKHTKINKKQGERSLVWINFNWHRRYGCAGECLVSEQKTSACGAWERMSVGFSSASFASRFKGVAPALPHLCSAFLCHSRELSMGSVAFPSDFSGDQALLSSFVTFYRTSPSTSVVRLAPVIFQIIPPKWSPTFIAARTLSNWFCGRPPAAEECELLQEHLFSLPNYIAVLDAISPSGSILRKFVLHFRLILSDTMQFQWGVYNRTCVLPLTPEAPRLPW